eukprot:8782557-Lingulodinium_polyedra.AAC.1
MANASTVPNISAATSGIPRLRLGCRYSNAPLLGWFWCPAIVTAHNELINNAGPWPSKTHRHNEDRQTPDGERKPLSPKHIITDKLESQTP